MNVRLQDLTLSELLLTPAQAASKAWLAVLRKGLATRPLAESIVEEFASTRVDYGYMLDGNNGVRKVSGYEHFVNAVTVIYDL